MDILKRMHAARSAAVTCSASRHAAQIGAALVLHDGDWRLANAPRECGESIAATVAALWEARAEVERLRTDLETAERALDAQTDFRAEIARLRSNLAVIYGNTRCWPRNQRRSHIPRCHHCNRWRNAARIRNDADCETRLAPVRERRSCRPVVRRSRRSNSNSQLVDIPRRTR